MATTEGRYRGGRKLLSRLQVMVAGKILSTPQLTEQTHLVSACTKIDMYPRSNTLCQVCLEALDGVWDPKKTPRIVELDTADGTDGPGPDLLENMRKWSTGVLNKENIASHQHESEGSPDSSNKDERDCSQPENPKERPEIFKYIFGHHSSFQSLERSSEENCAICTVLSFSREHMGVTRSFRNFATSFAILPDRLAFQIGVERSIPETQFPLLRSEGIKTAHYLLECTISLISF